MSSNINVLCDIVNSMNMVHNNYYLHQSQSNSAVPPPWPPSVKVTPYPRNMIGSSLYIALPRNHTDSQARSSNRPTVGDNGRNRIIAHNNAGNDTNRPAVVDDIHVIPRSGMAESCL